MEAVNKDNLFKYSKREDTLNWITHGIGALLSIVALIFLLTVHNDVDIYLKFGIIIYGLSMFALFLASCLYHKEQNVKKRAFLKRMDHAMILVMISGTYAPFCLVIRSKSSLIILSCVYILSVIGILLKVKYINISKVVSIIIYLIVGWLAIFMMKDILNFFDAKTIELMIAGGVTYSIGALVYAFTKFEFHHTLWHVFVLVAAFMFFLAINFALNV